MKKNKTTNSSQVVSTGYLKHVIILGLIELQYASKNLNLSDYFCKKAIICS